MRTQQGEVQPGDPRALAVRADRLWSVQATKAAGTAAVADGQEDPPAASVAAVRGAGGRGRGGRSCGRGAARGVAKAPAATAAPTGVTAAEPTPSYLARIGSGLCFFPWTFEDKATKCVAPCLNNVVPGSLVHIVDQLSNRRFLVETSASYSIFPHTSSAAPSGPKLRGAAGQL
ncbi:MAG: hypothetical protein ACK559_04800, partial [bacterium]